LNVISKKIKNNVRKEDDESLMVVIKDVVENLNPMKDN
jgi:hypothetical protein